MTNHWRQFLPVTLVAGNHVLSITTPGPHVEVFGPDKSEVEGAAKTLLRAVNRDAAFDELLWATKQLHGWLVNLIDSNDIEPGARAILERAENAINQADGKAPIDSVTIPLEAARSITVDLGRFLDDWSTGMDDGAYDDDLRARSEYQKSENAHLVLARAIGAIDDRTPEPREAEQQAQHSLL